MQFTIRDLLWLTTWVAVTLAAPLIGILLFTYWVCSPIEKLAT